MTAQRIPAAPPCTLFLFGANGDLVKRLLMPALYNLSRDGLLDRNLRIVGVDHNPATAEAFAERLHAFMVERDKGGRAPTSVWMTKCGRAWPNVWTTRSAIS